MSSFDSFGLDPTILAAVQKLGFESATPVQAETIPPLLQGRDVIAQARTGSGKTAAFGLPLLQLVKDGGKDVRGLVLAPTRELALQVCEALRSFAKGLGLRVVPVYGGAPYPPQLKALRNGATIVVGTPGRVIDHMERGTLRLGRVQMLVLDEADEMLNMGFLEPVEQVLEALPEERQIALFSATMPGPIQRVSKRFLNDPVTLQVESAALTVDHIDQRWIRTPERRKLEAVTRILRADPSGATLIFTRTRKGCAEVADALIRAGVPADAIHGELNQAARERVLKRLRSKSLSVLVATDVAARGLDVSHLTRVINFDYPNGPETYVHRIGRTGRAGAAGLAITLVTPAEQRKLSYLQRAIKFTIQETRPPTLLELADIERGALWNELGETAQDSRFIEIRQWLEEASAGAEDGPTDPLDIATSAVQLLTKQRGIDLCPPDEPPPPPPRAERPQPNRRPARGPSGPRRGDEVEIFLSIGKTAGVRPADIVGALANEVGLAGGDIGRIDLFDNKAFVGLPKSVAEQVLASFPTLTIRGRPIRLSRAWNRHENGPGFNKRKGRSQGRGPKSHHRRRKGAK